MRVTLNASLMLFSVSVVAAACGGDEFAPSASGEAGNAGSSAAGSSAAGSSGGGGAKAGSSGASGFGNAGNAGAPAAGAAGSSTAKACETGADCGKADPCKGVPYCSDNECFLDTSGVPSIEDDNKCTQDACSPVTGLPTHVPIAVGDGDPCTKDTCDPIAGPAHVVDPACTGCKADAECDDGDPCTEDTCKSTKCSSKPKAAGSECGAGDACTGKPVCDATGACKATEPKTVDDGDECTVDSCDPQTGTVKHAPRPIDDGDLCTTDACHPQNGISHEKVPIDDEDLCTKDACNPKTGVSHTPLDLGDGDLCTVDTCNPKTGPKHTPDPTCDGKCKSDQQCADTNPCTKDICTAGVCSNPPNDGAPCDDGLYCTANDTCLAGVCQAGPAVTGDDGKACTIDSCDEANDKPVNAPVAVDDGDACTQDSCVPDTGKVVNSPIANCCTTDAHCDKIFTASDSGVCRKAGGKCQENHTCLKNPETPIDDADACTNDLCDPATGSVTHPVIVTAGSCCAADTDCPGGVIQGRCFAQGTCNQTSHACTAGADGGPIDDANKCTADVCLASGKVDHQVIPGNGCCTDDSQCPQGGELNNTCVPASKCNLGKCEPGGSGFPRPGADTECTVYKCQADGTWASCCLEGGAECPLCPILGPDPVCGGIKG